MSARERRAKERRRQRRPVRVVAPVAVSSAIMAGGLATGAAPAQALSLSVSQVANLNLVASGSDPHDFTSVGGDVYFVAYQAGAGQELWETDGGSTHLVDDIVPGNGGSYPRSLTNVGGKLFFTATDSSGGESLYTTDGSAAGTTALNNLGGQDLTAVGNELYFESDGALWKSDGTSAGTQQVATAGSGGYDYYPTDITAVGSTIYFVADGQLWSSDGNSGATQVSITGVTGFYSSGQYITGLQNVGGLLYFAADGPDGTQVWTYNGSAATDVDTIDGTAGSERLGALTSFDGKLYFSGNDGTNGPELWSSDGTHAGTTVAAAVTPATSYGYSYGSGTTLESVALGGDLYFEANNGSLHPALWKTDGTTASQVTSFGSGSYYSYLEGLTSSGGKLFFSDNGVLYSSDGTSAGTASVPGGASVANSYAGPIAALSNGDVVFSGADSTHGTEPWVSGGSSMSQIADINSAGNDGSYPGRLTNVDGTLYFTADDGVHGTQLWKSGGGSATPTMISIPGFPYAYPEDLTNFNGTLYFEAGDEVWALQGGVPTELAAPSGTFDLSNLTVAGSELYLTARAGGGQDELLETGGSSALTQVSGVPSGSYAYELTNVGGTLYFAQDNQLYTVAGGSVSQVANPSGVTSPYELTAAGDQAYLSAYHSGAYGLWTDDAGTLTAVSGAPSNPDYLTNVGGTLYFAGGGHVYEVSGSNATEVNNPTAVVSAAGLTADGSDLYFFGYAPGEGEALWKAAGGSISFVAQTPDAQYNYYGGGIVNFNGTLMFTTDGSPGPELWQSDGTAAGTQLVASIDPGARDSYISDLTPVGGTLFFNGNDGTDGPELWQASSGTGGQSGGGSGSGSGGGTTGGGTTGGGTTGGGTTGGGTTGGGTTGGTTGGGTTAGGGTTGGTTGAGTTTGGGSAPTSLSWGAGKTKGTEATFTFTLHGAGSYQVKFTLSVVETIEGKKILGVTAADRGGYAKRIRKHKRTVIIGGKIVTATGGDKQTVTVTLNGAGKKLLTQRRHLRVHLAALTGGHSIAGRTLNFTQPKPKKHK